MRRSIPSRYWIGAVVAAAALAVSACSNSTSTTAPGAGSASGPAGPTASTAKPIKSLLFVNPLPDYPAWKTIGACMQQEAAKQGIAFTQAGPTGNNVDTTLMINEIQQGIANKVGAIVTFPVSAPQFDPLFAQARQAGIYVGTVEGGQTTGENVNAGTSFEQFGQLAAKTVASKPGHQYVAFLTEGPTGPDATFVKAFIATAKQYPSITIVTTRYDGGNVTQSVDLATEMMTANPKVNMFVTNEGADTPGIIAAIKQKSQVGKVFLTTNGTANGSEPGMKAGIVYSFLLQNMCQIGTAPVDALVKISKGQPVAPNIPTQIAFATKGTLTKLTASGAMQ
jgi:ABC-type sugar transport system substrate-binding protein